MNFVCPWIENYRLIWIWIHLYEFVIWIRIDLYGLIVIHKDWVRINVYYIRNIYTMLYSSRVILENFQGFIEEFSVKVKEGEKNLKIYDKSIEIAGFLKKWLYLIIVPSKIILKPLEIFPNRWKINAFWMTPQKTKCLLNDLF